MTDPPSSAGAGTLVQDAAMRAFIATAFAVQPSAPSWDVGWSAHEVIAHVTAAAQERADLIEEHLAGAPARATRSWEVREPPYRALPPPALREQLVAQATRFESTAAAMRPSDELEYTGWRMSADRLRYHSHSEAALHRWDLVGDDPVSLNLLADPHMVTHALAVFTAIPALQEAQRWTDTPFTDQPIRLRAPDQPDVTITPGQGLSAEPATSDDPPTRPTITTTAPERVLILWGRCPAHLRHPEHNAEDIDTILARLITTRPT